MSWLNEPEVEDISIKNDESYMSWLRRNTSPKAKKSRAFLNHHIEELPNEWTNPENPKQGLKHDLEHRWASAFFELICARVLQKLGASLKVEVVKQTKDGTITKSRPDFTTTFPDCPLIVEAKSTILNPDGRKTSKDQTDLINLIKIYIPKNWSFMAWALPQIGQSDSKKEFKKVISEIVSTLPTPQGNASIYVTKTISSGDIYLEFIPKETNSIWLAGPGNDSPDDAKEKIKNAIHGKRGQVAQSSIPVILAINMDGMGASFEDFDQVLFGYSWYHVNKGISGFKADGLFVQRPNIDKPPTFAGILAFFNVGLWGWDAQPILFLNSNFTGKLPNRLLALERRFYDSETNTIIRFKSQLPELSEEMLFATKTNKYQSID